MKWGHLAATEELTDLGSVAPKRPPSQEGLKPVAQVACRGKTDPAVEDVGRGWVVPSSLCATVLHSRVTMQSLAPLTPSPGALALPLVCTEDRRAPCLWHLLLQAGAKVQSQQEAASSCGSSPQPNPPPALCLCNMLCRVVVLAELIDAAGTPWEPGFSRKGSWEWKFSEASPSRNYNSQEALGGGGGEGAPTQFKLGM